jgi:GntR family transcriptional regulator
VDLPTLDRHSVVPLYYQIQQHLFEQIRAGILRPGKPIPSEQEIFARLRISRMTARQALKSLCDLGATYSQRGKGTFASTVKLEKNSRQVLSFSEEMQACGSRARSKVLSFDVATASPDAADAHLHSLAEPRSGSRLSECYCHPATGRCPAGSAGRLEPVLF